ncbi:nitrate transporter NrtA [Motiliproteus coralliicola]|uniref:Nitrate transporter NrtA n=1 Tax=Motiliproteus coralliicola TaxID=2283196 RepID=A0A369W9U5_9GAMM|nr:CmpA/NrtA family ABC transporter substrate-binding protein [Motiliproteus coralliicola]RDE18091.1 nitrate transporter NrtA [Motiliproteus coralliicola]
MAEQLKLGFVPLLDCAPLVVAREQGLFREQGLNVVLSREASWSSIRDKLNYGLLDGAQMLAPMPLAATLGLGSPALPSCSLMSLSRNGNAITCSVPFYQRLYEQADGETSPTALGSALRQQLSQLGRKPVFATVYPYSNHHYLLRDWLSRSGINPDTEIDWRAIPPAQMITALAQRRIDGYCVGEPWNSLAVLQGHGLIVAPGQQLCPEVPEKVFAVTQAWAEQHPESCAALIRALYQACHWISQCRDKQALLELLALPPYLDHSLLPLLETGYQHHWGSAPLHQQFFDPQMNAPSPLQGQWLVRQMLAAGQLSAADAELANRRLLPQVFRIDLFEQATRAMMPQA